MVFETQFNRSIMLALEIIQDVGSGDFINLEKYSARAKLKIAFFFENNNFNNQKFYNY